MILSSNIANYYDCNSSQSHRQYLFLHNCLALMVVHQRGCDFGILLELQRGNWVSQQDKHKLQINRQNANRINKAVSNILLNDWSWGYNNLGAAVSHYVADFVES